MCLHVNICVHEHVSAETFFLFISSVSCNLHHLCVLCIMYIGCMCTLFRRMYEFISCCSLLSLSLSLPGSSQSAGSLHMSWLCSSFFLLATEASAFALEISASRDKLDCY